MQDGFDLCLPGFIVTDEGRWAVVQQGMNGEHKQARRYHWLSEGLKSFVEEPHAAIDGLEQGEIVNLTDRRAEASRRDQLEMLQSIGLDKIADEFARLENRTEKPIPPNAPEQPFLCEFSLNRDAATNGANRLNQFDNQDPVGAPACAHGVPANS